MALKPTIYKVDLQLVDMNREVYTSEKLTLAQHPSETLERMMVRLVVYGLNYHEQLQFCKGLSTAEEADLWQVALNGQIEHWLEVGQATPERIRKGVSRAAKVSLYAYGREANIWWINMPKRLLSCLRSLFGNLRPSKPLSWRLWLIEPCRLR